LFEGEPQRQRQEIAERERRFVERPPQRLSHVAGEGGLGPLEALERFVELAARFFVVIREAFAHRFERVLWHSGVGGDGANGGASNPHGVVKGLACKIERGNSSVCV